MTLIFKWKVHLNKLYVLSIDAQLCTTDKPSKKNTKLLWFLRTPFEKIFQVAEKIAEIEKVRAMIEERERLDKTEALQSMTASLYWGQCNWLKVFFYRGRRQSEQHAYKLRFL